MEESKLMTYEEMKQILLTEIPFDTLEKNRGIYEFHEVGFLSIGISYEDVYDPNDIYYYNLFWADQYIDIGAIGTKSEPVNDDAIWKLVNKWNELFLKSSIHNNK